MSVTDCEAYMQNCPLPAQPMRNVVVQLLRECLLASPRRVLESGYSCLLPSFCLGYTVTGKRSEMSENLYMEEFGDTLKFRKKLVLDI